MMNKKNFLDLLYERFGDFCVASLYYKDKVCCNKFLKWYFYSDIRNTKLVDLINNRTIFDVEIVLDLDDKDKFSDVIKQLNQDSLNYYVFHSGHKGYHIHLFFPELRDFSVEERKEFKKNLIKKYSCDLRKSSERTMISLEHFPHFKTNRPKQLLYFRKGFNFIDERASFSKFYTPKVKSVDNFTSFSHFLFDTSEKKI